LDGPDLIRTLQPFLQDISKAYSQDGGMEVCMRSPLIALFLTAFSTSALAQDSTPPCHPVSPTEQVIVKTHEGRTIRGTLLCLTDQDVLLTRDGRFTRTPLDSVGRIVTPPDPVWDGAAKGAAIPLILYAVFCHGCEGGGEFILRSTLAYSAIGLAIDALDTNRKTLYKGSGRSASVGWRVRF
jgi:hypothetical protein